jgi:hypothetical protein
MPVAAEPIELPWELGHEHLRRNRAFAEMFLKEARLAARIRHHNVVATLDVSDGNRGPARCARVLRTRRRVPRPRSLRYVAPEQVESDGVTTRADVFSAGVVLWELLTRTRLFRSGDDRTTMNAVLTRAVPAPSSVEPSVPPELDEVLLRALERDPSQRFESAGDFLAALEHLPLQAATARRVGEYVRCEGGASLAWRRLPSGRYPRALAAEARRLHEPLAEAVDDDSAIELPTRVCEPPQALVVSSTREPEASVPDAYPCSRSSAAASSSAC